MINIDSYEGSTRGERYQNCMISILSDIRDELRVSNQVNSKSAVVNESEPLNTIVKKHESTIPDYDFTKLNTSEMPSHEHSIPIVEVEEKKTAQRKKRTKKEE